MYHLCGGFSAGECFSVCGLVFLHQGRVKMAIPEHFEVGSEIDTLQEEDLLGLESN